LSRKQLQLKERPLVVMDCSLFDYNNDGYKEAEEKIKKMQKDTTIFTILWHNSYIKHIKFYEKLIEKITLIEVNDLGVNTMRLTKQEITSIRKAFIEVFKDGKIYLFGSRADDSKRGGDIDLYVDLNYQLKTKEMMEKKSKFRLKLYEMIGEQKIDVIVAKDKNRLIEQEALKTGVDLMNIRDIKSNKYLKECEKHQLRIRESFEEIQDIFPLSGKKYLNLSSYEVKNIDQYLFRFSKMQDTIGEKLFKLIVQDFVENIDTMTFIDVLNRLEKIGIIESSNDWQTLRKARNNIAHQYDDEPDEMAEAINRLFAQKEILLEVFKKIKDYYDKK